MLKQNSIHTFKAPPPKLLPILEKIKLVYKLWFLFYQDIPKTHRFTLGTRIDGILIEMIEMTSMASFTPRQEKLPFVRVSIRKLDTLRILLLILWETKSLDNKKYIALSEPLEEIGKMLGGWHGQIIKQNSPNQMAGEK